MSDRRLVFLHGFTQSHHHWHECAHLVAEALGGHPTLSFVDMPGHGLSEDDRLSVEDAAPRMVALGGTGTYIGYSMGARHALAAACSGLAGIERLVLVGGTAGLERAEDRAARIAHDADLADRIENIGVETFVDEWLTQPLFARLSVNDDDRAHRVRNSVSGLAASLRLAGTGSQRSHWDDLAHLDVPVLVLSGERDAKFTAIGRRLTDAIPNATFASVPDAGHAVHAEQPTVTATLIADWLRDHTDPRARPKVSRAP
jgi:2-succinyl-6-hydroxy-2,4-cyclohexadiene-1-carboxylate synthase